MIRLKITDCRLLGSSMHLAKRVLSRVAVAFVCACSCSIAEESTANKTIESAFDSKVVKLHLKPGEQSITAEWSYTNRWDFPLAVEKFDSSCGCLSGQADQKILEPGQSDMFRATFAPGRHRGLLRKSLHVRFVGHDKPVELVVEATIPSAVELSAQDLAWNVGGKPETRIIDVKTGTNTPFTITGLPGVPDSLFAIASETIAEGKHYQLRITPKAALAEGIHILQVRTDSKDPRDQVLAVFLHIRPPAAHPPAGPTQTAAAP